MTLTREQILEIINRHDTLQAQIAEGLAIIAELLIEIRDKMPAKINRII